MASDDLRLHFGWSQANNCLWFSKNDLKDYASELFTLLFSIISDKITLYLSSGVFRARGPEVTASSLSCRSVSHYPSPDPARNTQTGRLPPPPPRPSNVSPLNEEQPLSQMPLREGWWSEQYAPSHYGVAPQLMTHPSEGRLRSTIFIRTHNLNVKSQNNSR